MPNSALCVQTQPGNCSTLQQPEEANPAAQQSCTGAELSPWVGGRQCCSIVCARRRLPWGTEPHLSPPPARSWPSVFSRCLYKTRSAVSSYRAGQGSEAGRMPVSREGSRGKQDAQIMLAQLGCGPPGYVMNCSSIPGRRDRHLQDYIQTLKHTPTNSHPRPLILLYDQTVITLQQLLEYYIFITVMSLCLLGKKYAYFNQ